MATTNETKTSSSDSDESLAPAAEELVFHVVSPLNSTLDDLVRRFPDAAEFLRLTAPVLPRESTVEVTPTAANPNPAHDANGAVVDEGTAGGPCPSSILARGQALEICRKFEADLKKGLGPSIENCVRDVAEPQRSALLSMLVAAELRFRLRNGERPTLEQYCTRFSAHSTIIEAVFAASVGPDRIGSFGVLRFLGGGTFGRVYLCRDTQLDRLVAIKVPRPDSFSGPAEIERFLREARLAAKIKHPGIVSVHQVDRDPAVGCFVVLEYIEGRSLSAHLDKKRLVPRATAEMIISIAEALSFAHEQGLVHRDLKPANILLDLQERPHIADFGLAVHEDERWPSRGEVAGTPPYMAPEQVRGESHRLDGRTDIWGLGVILYRMLTGHRPFDGTIADEVFDEILLREPVPPRQRDRTVPKELERICLKCLSKRMTDRYATATDLADDLGAWLAHAADQRKDDRLKQREPETGKQPGETSADESAALAGIKVRPKGLRAFDIDDRDFFLGLLPGPRDRDGLPESLRFWKTRIEPGEHDNPFSVGLLCGPSGSGKTSMIKAGLLGLLSPAVIPVYVEASPDTTEVRLKGALHRIAAGAAGGSSLIATLAGIRGRALLPEGGKVLIVLDQFEQWLHGDHQQETGELVQALRQCDGDNLQCLALVRDDFAMAAARFMRSLEIRLVESHNFATVDLFDRVHARKVLRAFGMAYDRFGPADKGSVDRFLDQAVSELAVDGKVAPVRLALFAQMINDKPWTPTTLREVGGLEGVGVTFLEQSLAGPGANPEHRMHLPAARRVLKALLPQGGVDIKGHMRSFRELLEVSGYGRRPSEFETLLLVLGAELRLITPTDPRGVEFADEEPSAVPAGRYYHLTHDYLVPSLREWINSSERKTIAGRTALRLAECTAEWTTRKSSRYLPAWWEWLAIVLFVRRSRCSPAERRLVAAATRYNVARLALAAVAVATLCVLLYNFASATRARGAVRELAGAQPNDVRRLLKNLASFQPWTDRYLREILDDKESSERQKVRARLGLLPVDASQTEAIFDAFLDGGADDVLLICDSLREHADRRAIAKRCRGLLGNTAETSSRKFRAGVALASGIGDSPASNDAVLHNNAESFVDYLLAELLTHPDRCSEWAAALRPAATILIPPLETVFRDSSQQDGVRVIAAKILAQLADPGSPTLMELLLDANTLQFPVIVSALQKSKDAITPGLLRLITDAPPAGVGPEAKYAFVGRQANAAVALLHIGDPDHVWPLLRHRPDPLLRTYLIERLSRLAPKPSAIADRIADESDVSARFALILVLGGMPRELRSPSWTDAAAERLTALFERDPDAGIHSAAEWALRAWGKEDRLRQTTLQLPSGLPGDRRTWSLTANGHTMVKITGPTRFRMGASDYEDESDGDETPVIRDIARSFLIATKETSLEQFLEFQGKRPERGARTDGRVPMGGVPWLDAARYCRWLSEKQGIPLSEMCYPPVEQITEGFTPDPNLLRRTGYRLPTEAELEYAGRARAVTSRFYGDDPKMLSQYAWFLENYAGVQRRCGSLRPNDFGLFDALGGVKEWCEGAYNPTPIPGPDIDEGAAVDARLDRVARGGCYGDRAPVVRLANRYHTTFSATTFTIGFRVARTASKAD
jgi:serine/threonine protein kinase/formylglycine-generating enzyme required for sulfatase activity